MKRLLCCTMESVGGLFLEHDSYTGHLHLSLWVLSLYQFISAGIMIAKN